MLATAMRIRPALVVVMVDMQLSDGSGCFHLSQNDWRNLEECFSFLGLFDEATKECCGDKRPTLFLVVPIYNQLLDHVASFVEKHEQASSAFSCNMLIGARACQDKLGKYYNVSSEWCTVATVMDSRLKIEYYEGESGEGHQTSEK